MKPLNLLLVWMLCTNAHADTIQVTILVDDSYRPFSYREDNVAKGFYIEVLKTAFSRIQGYSVTLEPIPWQRGKQMMKDGEEMGLAPAFFHGHDWPYLYPYSLPIYTETIIAVCGADVLNPPRPNWPDDYLGLTIGNVTGFDGWGGDAFHALVKQGKMQLEEAKGSAANILKLAQGRVDCIMMEERAFDYEFAELQSKGMHGQAIRPISKGAIIGTDPVYVGYSKPAREKGKYPFLFNFMQALDVQLYKMTKSGETITIMDAFKP
jgi:polar amino acid transport system substrate-binding protein